MRPRRPPARVRVNAPVREAAASWLERVPPVGVLLGVVALSVAAHAGTLALVERIDRPRALPPAPPPVRVTVIEPPAPPPPEAPPPPAPPPRPLPVVRHRKQAPAPPTAAPPPDNLAPPPPNQEAPAETPPPLVIPGAALSATTSTGTVAVGVGNTMRGKPSDTPAADAKPYRAAEYAESYALTEEPVYLDNVSPARVRSFYPEDARRAQREGAVKAKVLVDADGSVARVTLVEDPGHGFGAAALRVARLYRFKPGRVNGRAVATEIVVTIRFDLD